MRLYTLKDKHEVAVAYQGKLYPIKQFHISCQTMNELIADEQAYAVLKGLRETDFQGAEGYDEADCPLCAPIVTPLQDVICLGVNYLEHIEETTHVEDFRKKNATVYFSKRANEVTGHQGVIPHYDFVSQLDYEVELAVIIGKDAKGVSEAEALDYAFGYTILNDFSARELQSRHRQWYLGKSLDGYTAMGPCIVTADELCEIDHLDLKCFVNGELRQSSNTSLMIQSTAGAISELSQGMTLKAGTIISTGTPGGVALGMKHPVYLKTGDQVVCEIEGIGTLTNIIG